MDNRKGNYGFDNEGPYWRDQLGNLHREDHEMTMQGLPYMPSILEKILHYFGKHIWTIGVE